VTRQEKKSLLDRLLDAREELTRLSFNAILRGETTIEDCPQCVAARKTFNKLYERFVSKVIDD
jgi:hypothetical protein